MDGYSPQEIGEILGLTPAGVRSHLRHARNNLKRILESEPSGDRCS
ncbi:sigma factor-like helix-turn-helix DNA-binding protein [Streptomyces roseochromogenus]